jgi:hypothetical protein
MKINNKYTMLTDRQSPSPFIAWVRRFAAFMGSFFVDEKIKI